MKIYLVRHGETTGDLENRYGGDYDDHLTERGVAESEELGNRLKKSGIEIIYSSPRIRALETAEIVNKHLNVKIQKIEDFRERNNYGVLTGMIKQEAKQKHPDQVAELEKGIHHTVQNSEGYDAFKERIMYAFKLVASNPRYSTIAIITHGGPIRCIIREVLKLGELELLDDCAIISIDETGGKFSLLNIEGARLK